MMYLKLRKVSSSKKYIIFFEKFSSFDACKFFLFLLFFHIDSFNDNFEDYEVVKRLLTEHGAEYRGIDTCFTTHEEIIFVAFLYLLMISTNFIGIVLYMNTARQGGFGSENVIKCLIIHTSFIYTRFT